MKRLSLGSILRSAALAAMASLSISCPPAVEDVNVREAIPSGIDYSFVIWRIDLPGKIPAGKTISVPVELLNNGNKPWLDDGEPYFLSYHWKHPGGQFNREMFWGLRTPIPTPVGAGELIDFEMKIAAPTEAKYYDITIDIVRGASNVREEVFWFEEGGWKTHDKRIEVTER
jgi:hypothetical protein